MFTGRTYQKNILLPFTIPNYKKPFLADMKLIFIQIAYLAHKTRSHLSDSDISQIIRN